MENSGTWEEVLRPCDRCKGGMLDVTFAVGKNDIRLCHECFAAHIAWLDAIQEAKNRHTRAIAN